MGWWKQGHDGASFTMDSEYVWGDKPADIVDEAIAKVREVFYEEWGRYPSNDELIAGFRFSTRLRGL